MNITINRNESGAFFVLHGDKFADQLTYEEMLGLVALIATPANPRALSWLKTADQWREQAAGRAARMTSACDEKAGDEPMFPADMPTATEVVAAQQATEPTSAQLREETIAIAVRHDGADDRVVGDWNPDAFSIFPTPTEVPANELAAVVDPHAAGPTLAYLQESGVLVTPIRRADVRLKVGDVVADRSGVAGVVVFDSCSRWDGFPLRTSFRDGEYAIDYRVNGLHTENKTGPCDITTLNGRPIIDAEEA